MKRKKQSAIGELAGSENGGGFSVFRKMSHSPAVAVHGQVNTLPHIVEFILDLAGYTTDKPLYRLRLLEPGSGNGAFLFGATRRLLAKTKNRLSVQEHAHCLLGVEKNPDLVAETRRELSTFLEANEIAKDVASELARAWVVCADFLAMAKEEFDFVVGNPPYVRQEAIEKKLVEAYREKFRCFYDRADLYIAFFEHSLEMLSDVGSLAFICPNRFTKNNYGKKLRKLISDEYKLTHVVDLARASPFAQEVISYPAIYVVRKGKTESVSHLLMQKATPEECNQARHLLTGENAVNGRTVSYHRYDSWFSGDAKWATHSPEHLGLLRRLEAEGLPLGNPSSGCKVGIGIATGADEIFLVRKDEVDVEEDLLLPILTTKDIATGEVLWGGRYLINPFRMRGAGSLFDDGDSGELIDLNRYPRAKRYFESFKARLTSRHVGKRNPLFWFRTIDKVHLHLADAPMVLIPDIKGSNVTAAMKEGYFYPHHNLYFVTSDMWDLPILRSVLRSSIARFFVFMYGVKMRMGYYRFQAQYLRKIVVPARAAVSNSLVEDLAEASTRNDEIKTDELLANLYRLSKRDRDLLRSFDEASQACHFE